MILKKLNRQGGLGHISSDYTGHGVRLTNLIIHKILNNIC